MSAHSHNDSISLPKYKAKHVPKLSLLPFEIYAPASQLSPPSGYAQSAFDEYFSPIIDSPAIPARSELRDMYFGPRQHQALRPDDRQRTSTSQKKPIPSNQRFPEFVPHHTRNSSSTSTWAKSSTSSATLAVAETRTILAHPPRKGSEITIDYGHRKDSETSGKFTGDNRGRKNYSMPRFAYEDSWNQGNPVPWTPPIDDYDNGYSPLDRERKDSKAMLIPSPLEVSRRPSYGSLRTPLPIPSEDLATPKAPSRAQLSRNPSLLGIPADVPRKDSSTLPLGVEYMTPSMVGALEKPWDKYKSQMMGNPFHTLKNPPISSTIYEDDKFDVDSWPLPLPAGRKSKVDRHSILKLQLGALDMTDSASIYTARKTPKPYSYFIEEPESRYTKVKRVSESCWGRWSTRQLILAATALIVLILLAVGLTTGIIFNRKYKTGPGLTPTWRPAIGNTWQIQSGETITTPSLRSQVYDIDLFDNNASTIDMLHHMGRRVICYFSAGSFEHWRPDADKFTNITLGKPFHNWDNETWLDTSSQSVRDIMGARIQLAKDKGCDGVDPDNVDGYLLTSTNGTGFQISESSSADYVRWLASAAHHLDIAIGLKNAPELINKTLDVIDWQLNEGCVSNGDCEKYQPFIEAGKPVFHIEYASNASASVLDIACKANGTQHFSTLIKKTQLDAWAAECPYGDPAYGAD